MSRPVSGATADALRSALAGARTARSGDEVERVLAAAGDLLRRSQSLPCPRAAIDAALVDLDGAATIAWTERAPADGLGPQLRAAVDDAVEILTGGDGRAQRERSALDALQARDRLESCLVALGRRQELVSPTVDETHAKRELSRRVGTLDKACRSRARAFVVLNGARRAERDRLDADRQGTAWWWSDRADCDDLASILAGQSPEPNSNHLASCSACAADASIAKLADEPVGPHPSSDLLWQLDSDDVDPALRRRVERHAERCPDCADTLAAMRDADVAISQDA